MIQTSVTNLYLSCSLSLLVACSSASMSGSGHSAASNERLKAQDAAGNDPAPGPGNEAGTDMTASGGGQGAGSGTDVGSGSGGNAPVVKAAVPTFALPPGVTIPNATEAVYGNTFTSLYSVDAKTGASRHICDFSLANGAPEMTDMAINANGQMYGISDTDLYAIDPTTCALTHVLKHGVASSMGLTFLSDGTLIIAGDGVVAIDPKTQKPTRLVPAGVYETSGDIIALPDHLLYWSVFSSGFGGGIDNLVVIDPTKPSYKMLGSLHESGVFGLGYANGTLLGFNYAGSVFQISTSTGAATTYLTKKSPAWTGATTNPVLWP